LVVNKFQECLDLVHAHPEGDLLHLISGYHNHSHPSFDSSIQHHGVLRHGASDIAQWVGMCFVRPPNSNCDVHSSVSVGHCLQVATVGASGRGGCQLLPQCLDAFSPSKLVLPCAVEPRFIAVEC
jgi:hypothetical protein